MGDTLKMYLLPATKTSYDVTTNTTTTNNSNVGRLCAKRKGGGKCSVF